MNNLSTLNLGDGPADQTGGSTQVGGTGTPVTNSNFSNRMSIFGGGRGLYNPNLWRARNRAPGSSRDTTPGSGNDNNNNNDDNNNGPSGVRDSETKTPDEKDNEGNCSVYITNLPPDCTVNMLLSNIRNIGKIYASHVNPPTLTHSTAAAKIIFWDRASTLRFMHLSRRGRWTVGGYTPFVRYNRVSAPAQPESQRSRVIQIRGPADLLSEEYLKRVFNVYCTFEMDSVSRTALTTGDVQFEFRFSSYRAQAATAYKVCGALRTRDPQNLTCSSGDNPDFNTWMTEAELTNWARVRVHWAADPCA
ncbi:hypothetical protein F5X96DRAFT_676824 [Biscogniauxia mediterranea]|nr:hypothetical protein F5X96DRAFT_676824 [Biscogniauxia mediterranea]